MFVGEEVELPRDISFEVRPSMGEVEARNEARLPYRSWRRHRVSGKAGGGPQEEDGTMMGRHWNARCPSAQWTKAQGGFFASSSSVLAPPLTNMQG